jgi:hypothetical protein
MRVNSLDKGKASAMSRSRCRNLLIFSTTATDERPEVDGTHSSEHEGHGCADLIFHALFLVEYNLRSFSDNIKMVYLWGILKEMSKRL